MSFIKHQPICTGKRQWKPGFITSSMCKKAWFEILICNGLAGQPTPGGTAVSVCVGSPVDYKEGLPQRMEIPAFAGGPCPDFLHAELRSWDLRCDDN